MAVVREKGGNTLDLPPSRVVGRDEEQKQIALR